MELVVRSDHSTSHLDPAAGIQDTVDVDGDSDPRDNENSKSSSSNVQDQHPHTLWKLAAVRALRTHPIMSTGLPDEGHDEKMDAGSQRALS